MNETLALAGYRLDWGEDGQPRSTTHGDVYFSTENGLAETRHVFIGHNDLAARWAELDPRADFVIGESGFGTGLNFLAAWRQWRETAPPDATLHFLSVERHPLVREDLVRALAAFPELNELATELVAAWPAAFARGLHRRRFEGGRVSLTLALDEVLPGLEHFLDSRHPCYRTPRRGVDAWFLDGFAPARNPDMWRDEVLRTVAQLSAPGATFATFTAAGNVRRALHQAGFDVEKVPGYGRKRDMLRGRMDRTPSRPAPEEFPPSPYPDGQPHAWSVDATRPRAPHGSRVAVVGAGLAGCHIASALARRGHDVTLLDAEADLATGGSGNRQGVLYARPAASDTHASRFNLAALLFAQRHYDDLWQDPETGSRCGVLHLERNDRDRESQEALVDALHHAPLCRCLDPAEAGEVAGVPVPGGGLWFPDSGWLSPPAVCRQLLAGVDVRRHQARISALERDAGDIWILRDNDGEVCAEADVVVLACATGLGRLEATVELPVQPVRGQVSSLALDAGDSSSAAGRLRIALCTEGYVSPAVDGQLSFGASFVPNDRSTEPRRSETEENLERLRAAVPGLVSEAVTAADCTDRSGVRCATPDRLPLVGPVPEMALMEERFALLRKNARAAISAPGAWLPGVYVSAGYGSRGLAYIPLATEWLVAQICGEPPPLDRKLREALNPARFLIRDLRRNRR